MRTFEESVAQVISPEEMAVAEIRKTFSPVLAELRELQRTYPTRKAAWLSRVAVVQAREQQAAAHGVVHPRVVYLREDLSGGRSLSGGLLLSTGNQISQCIQKIERLSYQDLHQRTYLGWYRDPQRIGDNLRAIDERLAELETLVQDGGELHRLVERQTGPPTTATPTAA